MLVAVPAATAAGVPPLVTPSAPPGPFEGASAGGVTSPCSSTSCPASRCVAEAYGGSGLALTDFRQDGDGMTRILVRDRSLDPQQAGALIQRLIEIETYRQGGIMPAVLRRIARNA